LTVGEAASVWNSGLPDKYTKGTRGVGISSKGGKRTPYNVPKYVADIEKRVENIKGFLA